MKNTTFLKTIRKEPVPYTPIWLMRQAGRYLPEYRKLRAKAGSFLQLCKNPELACEVTLQPLARFNLDAAILFSDILTIPDAMGLGLFFKEGEGPHFEKPLRTAESIQKLCFEEPEEKLAYVYTAIQYIQKSLNGSVPLIGFCGSPWTVACYMIEGCANKNFPAIQSLLHQDPKILHVLLTKLADAVASHLTLQIKAGVDAVMLFDTWGGMLNDNQYKQFSLDYNQLIVQRLRQDISIDRAIPIILFTKGGARWLQDQATIGCDVLGVDHAIHLSEARKQVGGSVTLQGNLDPSILLSSPMEIEKAVKRILQEFGEGSGHIFNLSHGVTPDVPPDHVAWLVDCVHQHSKKFHG